MNDNLSHGFSLHIVTETETVRGIVAKHLHAPNVHVADTAVSGVKDEILTGQPLVDVARRYLSGWRIRGLHEASFVHPSANS